MTKHLKRIGIKYCGGCDPAYDRGLYVKQIQMTAGNQIEWVLFDQGGFKDLLIIHGCDTACIDPEPFIKEGIRVISLNNNEKSPEEILSILLKEKGE